MQSSDLIPAFSDPVEGSQNVFRVLLKALSEPGQIHDLTPSNQTHQIHQLEELSQAGYALALTLLDSSTTVWLSPHFSHPKIRQNLAFHCGCQFVDQPEAAMFAFLTANESEVLTRLQVGTDRDPELSCTAIVQLDQLTPFSTEVQSTWTGPGIKDHRHVALDINKDFWTIREQKNQFPRGIDVFFIAQNSVLGLARSTHVQPVVEA